MHQLIALKKKYFSSVIVFLFTTTLNAQLSANFYPDKQGGCSPLSVSFTNLSSGTSPNTTYAWDFGNGNTSALSNPGAIFTEEKTYTVTLTIKEGNQSSVKTTTITVYKKPQVDFSATSPKVCLPAAAGFTVNASAGDGSISGYSWDYGDGITEQSWGGSASHYYYSPQKPTVGLTVTNSYGCYTSVTKKEVVEILDRIEPVFTINKSLVCSLDESFQFINNSTGPGTLLYSWDFGDGSTSTQKNPVHKYSKKGIYNVRLTVSNTDGCSATGYPVSVNAAYFNTDFSTKLLCREVGFTSTSYMYPSGTLWQLGDGNIAYSTGSAVHTYTNAGNYTVTLINSYETCKDTVTKTIKVEDKVSFSSSIEAPGLLCKGSYYTFKSKSNVAPSGSVWEMGDGSSNNWWSEVNHAYTNPGSYTIKLTNTFGTCQETVSKQVTVHDLPGLKDFVVDYGGVCGSPVTVKFKDTTPGAVKWEWRLDNYYNNIFSTQQNATYSFPYDGSYWVNLSVTNAAGCSTSISKILSIYKPSVQIYLLSSSSQKGYYDCDSLRVTFAASANQPIRSYLWSFGDGTTSTEVNPEHSYTNVGVYNVVLNYVTESGCKGSASYTVRVYGKPKAQFLQSIPCGNSLDLQFIDQSYFSDNWEWNFGDNSYPGYGYNTYHTYSDTGKYNITFISHIGHCSDTIVKPVYANVLPSSVMITKAETTCAGTRGTVSFDQKSLRISSGTWNFGDGTIVPYDTSNHDVKHTYTKSGQYQVTLTGKSGNCTLTDRRIIYILLKQNPVLTANKTEICSNDNIQVKITNLEVNPYTGNIQYGQYYVNTFQHNTGAVFNGNYSGYDWSYTTYNATLQNFTAGTSQMRAVISNWYNGCTDTTNFVSLKVNGPIAGFKVLNNESCFKSAIIIQDTSKTSTNTVLKSWHWDFGDGTSETHTASKKFQHQYNAPGNYTVRLTVTDAAGCVSSFSSTVSARGPKASFTASGLFVPNVPLNTTVTFYNNTISWYSNSVNYTWSYGDGATSSDYYGSHTYTQPAVNTVKLIATDASIPCSDTAIQVITVKDFNTAFTFSTQYVANTTCPPVTIRINNLSVGYYNLVWDFGDGTTTKDQSYPSHTYYKPGTYKITLYTFGYNGLTGTYIDSVTVSAPAATIQADVLKGCTSQLVNLMATTTNTENYLWDFGDGTIKNGTTTMSGHQYLTPGVYQPKLIVKDTKGCTTAAALPDKIIIDSLYIAIKGIPAQICDSTMINFTPEVKSIAADQVNQPLIYHWDFGTGNPADTANSKDATFNFNKPGTYNVSLKVVSPFGCTKQVSQQVVVHKKATAFITGPVELCQGGSATFTGTASASPVDWSWNLGNGTSSSVQNPGAQIYSSPGTYNVELVVKYNGCSDTARNQLIVHPNPIVAVTSSKTLVCKGETLQINATGGESYIWNPSTGLNNATIASPQATPMQDTRYTVDVINQFGCKRSDSIDIKVVQPFNLVLATNAFVCAGNSVQLKADGASSYQWINNTQGLSNVQVANPLAAPVSNTIYTLVGSDAFNCFKDTAEIMVTVQPLPYVQAEPDFNMMAAELHQLQATASADVVQWLWSPETYLSCTDCPSPVASPRTPMDYVVTVKNQYGCQATDSVSISLACSEKFVFIPNSFTPNHDGKNDLFYIKGKGIGIIKSLVVYNRWGEAVFQRKNFNIDDRASAWDGKVKGITVPVGTYVYVVEMQCDSGQPIIQKGTVTVVY